MFNKEDEYLNATREAQLYTSAEIKSSNKKLIIINILLAAILSFATLYYLKNNTNLFSSTSLSSLPVSKQAVLGVSETVDDLVENSAIVLMSEPSIQSKSTYTKAFAKKLDDRSGFRGKIAVANQDDTFSRN